MISFFLLSQLGTAIVMICPENGCNSASLICKSGRMIALCLWVLQMLFRAHKGGLPRLYGLNAINSAVISFGRSLHFVPMVEHISLFVPANGKEILRLLRRGQAAHAA